MAVDSLQRGDRKNKFFDTVIDIDISNKQTQDFN